MRRITAGLLFGLLVGLVLAVAQGVGAAPPGLATIFEELFQRHHQELVFSVDPGDSYSFELPEVQGPVRIDVSFSLLNGGTQTPSEIMYALVCEGAGLEPQLGEPFPKSDPLASWLHARDWLDEVWVNAPACGSAGSSSQIMGRSSQYDWMRYFWDMATDEEVSVKKLVDIYVDMCPTNWVAAPPDTTPNANWPERRLRRSASFHGVLAKHNNQKSNGVDHD